MLKYFMEKHLEFAGAHWSRFKLIAEALTKNFRAGVVFLSTAE